MTAILMISLGLMWGFTGYAIGRSHGDQRERNRKWAILIAFVQGAAWWEYHKTGATMWQSDRRIAEEEAAQREQNGTLGVLCDAEKERGKP